MLQEFSQVLFFMWLGLSEGEVQCVLAGSSSPQHWPDSSTGLLLTVDQEECTCCFPSPFYSSLLANYDFRNDFQEFFDFQILICLYLGVTNSRFSLPDWRCKQTRPLHKLTIGIKSMNCV